MDFVIGLSTYFFLEKKETRRLQFRAATYCQCLTQVKWGDIIVFLYLDSSIKKIWPNDWRLGLACDHVITARGCM
jgi:hypothetical protein